MSGRTRPGGHRRLKEMLGSHVLGRLGAQEAAELEGHLGECAECRAEEAELRAVAERLPAGTEDLSPPPDLEDRVIAAALSDRRAHRSSGPRGTRIFSRLTAAAAILAVAAGIAFFAGALPGGPPGLGEEEPIAFAGKPAGVSTDAAVVAHTWGTEVMLEVEGLRAGEVYAVEIVRRGGESVPAGTFVAVADEPVECRLNGAVLRQNAQAVAVTDASGEAVMTSELSPRPDLALGPSSRTASGARWRAEGPRGVRGPDPPHVDEHALSGTGGQT